MTPRPVTSYTLVFTANDGTKMYRAKDGTWWVGFKPPSEYGRRLYPVHFFTVTVNSEGGTRFDALHFDMTAKTR